MSSVGRVRTFLEDIDATEMGFTYSHEHIVCVPPYWKERGKDDLLLDVKEKSKLDVMDFANLGGRTIVDATAIDYGRCLEDVVNISRETGVQIIGTAGFNKSFLWEAHLDERLKQLLGDYDTFTDWIDQSSINDLVNHVIQEVEEGMEGTKYKAGQVKFGTGYNSITPLEEKTIRAVARAHLETKAPIHSHTEAGTMALEQIEILKQEGVNLRHLSIGHMDRNLDPYMHIQVAKTGAFLSFDGIAKVKYAPESSRIKAILDLVRAGFEDQILVSGDTARKSYYKHYNYGLGLEYIKKTWVPRFMDEAEGQHFDGEKLIHKFFVENPKHCFSFKD
jgi:5-phospho-D-xylono-1,4-lactonase